MSRKGGYKIINLKNKDFTDGPFTIKGIYDRIENNYGKPLLLSGIVIDGVEKDDVFIEVKVKSSAFVIVVYDYKLTINAEDVVTLESVLDPVLDGTLMENIVDSDGHKRFVEGSITMETITGVTQVYGKWSLSGSHLMIVIVGKLEASASLPVAELAKVALPNWIYDKIVPFSSVYVDVDKPFKLTDIINYATEDLAVHLWKQDGEIHITNSNDTTPLSNEGVFRIQFDLLIDNE